MIFISTGYTLLLFTPLSLKIFHILRDKSIYKGKNSTLSHISSKNSMSCEIIKIRFFSALNFLMFFATIFMLA